jgi:hypothetical protein
VEPREWFYDDTTVSLTVDATDLHARKYKREVDPNRIWNTVEIGYEKWQAEAEGGLDEVNTKRQYRTLVRTMKNALKAMSNFVASGYAWEETRRQDYGTTADKDWEFDDELFVICLEDVSNPQDAKVEEGVGGTPDGLNFPDTMYNWRISPWANMKRWAAWAGQSAYPFTPGKLLGFFRFAKGQGNYTASGADNLPPLQAACNLPQHTEDDPINADGGRVAPYLRPEKITVETPLSLTELNALRANPYGLIRLDYGGGQTEDCFLEKCTASPGSQPIATLELRPKP